MGLHSGDDFEWLCPGCEDRHAGRGKEEGAMSQGPMIAKKGPFTLEMAPGVYWWCSCGRSATQPFCDGSHRGTAFTPVKVELTQGGPVSWCGCKHSGNGCRCDGTHRAL